MRDMSTIRTNDGTTIFYKDWGEGPAIVFSHGWPLNANAWDEQLHFFASSGYRAIAHDRRGFGRSSQPWNGHDMDTFADDLAALLDALGVQQAVLVGHSMGGGEVTRYLGRHGTRRVAKAVLVGAVPPFLLQTPANPAGIPLSVFNDIRGNLGGNRSQFLREVSAPFMGANRPDSKVPQGLLDQFWLWGMQASLKGLLDCIKAFSETDFTDDLKKIDVPTLIIHGDDDQMVPIEISARLAAKLVPRATLKVYPGASHGLMFTHRDQLNADLLAFIRDPS
jgi:non-heme chloroperoxidase